MDEIEVEADATPALEDPVLIEGLPGVGLVGKLAVDHLVEEIDGQPVRRVYSEHFPPAVSVDDEGVASLPALRLYHLETDMRDLLVLAGDGQAQEGIGQYRVAESVLDLADEFDVNEVVTLGGFGIGEQVDDYVVFGAAPSGSDSLRERFGDAGVAFDHDTNLTSIVGMSGLLVGLGARRGFEAAGLLGITPGYHVDPASARAVLEVLQEALGFSVSLETLEEQAEQVQQFLERLQERQQQQGQGQGAQQGQSGGNLRYIG